MDNRIELKKETYLLVQINEKPPLFGGG